MSTRCALPETLPSCLAIARAGGEHLDHGFSPKVGKA